MQRNWSYSALNICQEAINPERLYSHAAKEVDSVAFSAPDIQHGGDGEPLPQVAPQTRRPGILITMPNIAAQVWPIDVVSG